MGKRIIYSLPLKRAHHPIFLNCAFRVSRFIASDEIPFSCSEISQISIYNLITNRNLIYFSL